MEERAVTIGSTAESTSSRVIIPAVLVIGVLVHMIVAGAVYAVCTRRRRRGRRGQRFSRRDEEAGGFDDGAWREGNWDNHVRNGRLARGSRKMVFSGIRGSIIRPPKPAVTRSPRPPWDARAIVGRGFQRCSLGGANRAVNAGLLGHNHDASNARNNVHPAEISLGIHAVYRTNTLGTSKIERMTGSQLSNGLYEDLPSGRESWRDVHKPESPSPSYSLLNITIPPALLDLNTDISPTTTVGPQYPSTSAGSIGGTQLVPPPATPAYPNIAALSRANAMAAIVSEPPLSIQTTSFYARDQSISEHIATQFAPAKCECRRERPNAAYNSSNHLRRNSSTRTRKQVPPLSAAFGDFTGLTQYYPKASRASRASSISAIGLEEGEEENVPPRPSPTSKQRRPWNGRSVLLLDEVPRKPAQTTATPLSGSFPEAEGGEELWGVASAFRDSVSSMPSSVSSSSTMDAIGGLSPMPAPRPM